MLMPRKVKHRKQHRGRLKGMSKGGTELAFGEYGIQALEPGWITARQIEAARIAMTRHIKPRRQGLDQRLPGQAGHPEAGRDPHGFRQGQPERWVAVVQPGRDPVRAVVPEPGGRRRTRVEQAIQKLPIKARSHLPRGGLSDGRSQTASSQSSTSTQLLGELAMRRGRTTFNLRLPQRHRPARQHVASSARCAAQIARINTHIRQREIAAAEAVADGKAR